MLGEQRRRSVDVVSAAHVDALDVAAAAELTTVIPIAESDFPELRWRIESSAYSSASKGTTPVEGGTPQVKKKAPRSGRRHTAGGREKHHAVAGVRGQRPLGLPHLELDCNNTVGTESRTLNTGTRLRVLLRFTLRLFCCHPH